jgi:hypothetical protein
MKSVTMIAILACCLLTSVSATAQPAVAYAAGEIEFNYTGSGGYSESFHAVGPAGGAGEFILPEEAEGCGGLTGNTPDVHFFMASGAVRNPDSSQDIVVMVIYSDTESITNGSYPINPYDFSSIVLYLDDVTYFVYPEDTTELDWNAILGSVVAAHKYISLTGIITIGEINSGIANGTFSGFMSDMAIPPVTITVENGTFALTGGLVSAAEASFSELKSMFR